MKVRSPVPCERCKTLMHTGTQAIRFHHRLWHLDCAVEYIRARKATKISA